MPRKPMPTALKVKRGETRRSRLNLAEPRPRLRRPIPPKGLSAEAQTVWRAVLREAPPGMIVAIDGYVLEAFCIAVVERRRALEVYGKAGVPGLIRARGDGRATDAVVAHPINRVLSFWTNEVRVLARELGLSPSARAGLHVLGAFGLADSIEARIGPPPRLRAVAGGRPEDDEP